MRFEHNGGRKYYQQKTHSGEDGDSRLWSIPIEQSKRITTIIWGQERVDRLMIQIRSRQQGIHTSLETCLGIPLLSRARVLEMVAQEHQLTTPIELVYLDCACAVEDMLYHKRAHAAMDDCLNVAATLIQASHRKHVAGAKAMPERFVVQIYQSLGQYYAKI